MFIMFLHFKKKDRDECIDRIHRINTNLQRIMNGAPQTATVKANKLQKEVTRHYQRVRTHAIILYEALREGLRMSRCPCKVCTFVRLFESFRPLTIRFRWKMHKTILQLDVCIVGTQKRHNKIERFNILFPIPANKVEAEECVTLRQLEFEELENQDPEETALDG